MHQLEWFLKYNKKSNKTNNFEGWKWLLYATKLWVFYALRQCWTKISFDTSLQFLISVIRQITLYHAILSFYDAPKICFHSSLWSTSRHGYIVIFAYLKIYISLCFTLELRVLKVGRLIASSIVHMNTCQNKFGILHTYLMFKIVGEICVCCLRNDLYEVFQKKYT